MPQKVKLLTHIVKQAQEPLRIIPESPGSLATSKSGLRHVIMPGWRCPALRGRPGNSQDLPNGNGRQEIDAPCFSCQPPWPALDICGRSDLVWTSPPSRGASADLEVSRATPVVE